MTKTYHQTITEVCYNFLWKHKRRNKI